jgi:hypothetical protein
MSASVVIKPSTGNDGAHSVDWLDGIASFHCGSPLGSSCRAWCKTCDETCSLTNEDGTPHEWEVIDHCRVITYLDAYGADETFLGEQDELVREGKTVAITTEWDGDTYLWDYNAPATTDMQETNR